LVVLYVQSANAQRKVNPQNFIVHGKPEPRPSVAEVLAAHQAELDAANAAKWKAANPWHVLPEWKAATNRIAVLNGFILKNTKERELLVGAQQGESERAKRLATWLANERDALDAARAEKLKIQGKWRLDYYDKTNSPSAGSK
jgi:hypothetical protein